MDNSKRSIQGKLKLISKILIVVSICLVIITLIVSPNLNKVASSSSVIYDKQFVDALRRVSTFIPPDNVVVTSTNAPFVVFFTQRTVKLPIGVSSKETLLSYMLSHKYKYLLVFEGGSQVPELRTLFSSPGIAALKENFKELDYIQTDFTKIHLYALSGSTAEAQEPSAWSIYTIGDITDFGAPRLADINSIQIRITDNGTGPVSIWLGRLSLVDTKTQAETMLDTFKKGHSYYLQSAAGKQEDDISYSVDGSQSLKLTTEGDGRPVFTRKTGSSKVIDFTGKTVKLWARVSDISKLDEFRVTVSNDGYKSYRNFWIIR
jgi:hypothetical protein